MKRSALGMIAIVLLASTAPAALAADQQSSAYAGSTLSFDAQSNALVDYSVGGSTMAESIRVQSQSETDSSLGLGASADLGAVVNITGAALSVDSSTDASATVTSESGATMNAHDNGHGSLVIESGGSAQYVEVGLGAEASAASESDSRVVVTNEDGTTGTFIVVGEGDVTVNEDDNVSADVGSNGRLVFRSYTQTRSESDEQTEKLIADGTAAASVSLDGESNTVVNYDDSTTVNVTEDADGTVSMTVERSQSQGKVVVTSVAESTFESAEDVQVQVDGEAAARASSYSELESAANGGETSKFMVRQRSQASASADVLVGVNHFSERDVTMEDGGSESGSSGDGSSGDGSNSDGSDDTTETSSGNGPGFGAIGALLGLIAGGAFLATRN